MTIQVSSDIVRAMSEPIQRILEQELGKVGAAGASRGFELAAAIAEATGAGHLPDVSRQPAAPWPVIPIGRTRRFAQ